MTLGSAGFGSGPGARRGGTNLGGGTPRGNRSGAYPTSAVDFAGRFDFIS